MKNIKQVAQGFYKKTMMILAGFSLFSFGLIATDGVNYNNLNLQERCIANWLALSGLKASIFDKKVDFDEINPYLYPNLAKFITAHRCPVDLENLIISQLSFKDVISNKVQNLPYIMVKGASFDRLVNADRMRRCIEMNNLDRLMVPQKYIYKNGNDWGVAVLKIDICDRPLHFSLADIQQMYILAIETGYRDWKLNCNSQEYNQYRNYFYDQQGMIVCIDTEDLSYQVSGYGIQYLPFDCKANYASSLLYYKDTMDEDALNWLTAKVEELLKSPDAFTEYLSLPYNTKYDDPSINIPKTREEYQEFIEAGYNSEPSYGYQYQAAAA